MDLVDRPGECEKLSELEVGGRPGRALARPQLRLGRTMHSTIQRLQNVGSLALSVLFGLLLCVAVSSFALVPSTLPTPARLDVDPFNVSVPKPSSALRQRCSRRPCIIL